MKTIFPILPACAALLLGLSNSALAVSVAINFAAEQPGASGSSVTGAAGVLGTANWNNVTGATGSVSNLVDGDGSVTAAGVSWTSNNTWASTGLGEENNTAAPGNDRNLMTGYLDTNASDGVTVDLGGLGASSYDVYVYINGGVTGRGGDYTIGADTQSLLDTVPFDGTYTQGENYLVFHGVVGPSFTLTTTPTTGGPPRAMVNGIEIVGVPEAGASAAMLALGLLGLLGFRRMGHHQG